MKKEKTITVTMRLTETHVESLKKMARNLSYKIDKDISYHDLIRESIDMFLNEAKNEK